MIFYTVVNKNRTFEILVKNINFFAKYIFTEGDKLVCFKIKDIEKYCRSGSMHYKYL